MNICLCGQPIAEDRTDCGECGASSPDGLVSSGGFPRAAEQAARFSPEQDDLAGEINYDYDKEELA